MYEHPNRKATRLKDYNYSENGLYFITICTKDRENYFGRIDKEEMLINDIGEIAKENLENIERHYTNLLLDEFIIMPNHVHFIIGIDNQEERNGYIRSLQGKRQEQTLPKVIGVYKASVTREAKKNQDKVFFQWQKSYYDRIIRNEKELYKIREYIKNNPCNWESDEENTSF